MYQRGSNWLPKARNEGASEAKQYMHKSREYWKSVLFSNESILGLIVTEGRLEVGDIGMIA